MGDFREIHNYNREKNTEGYTDKLFSFLRWNGEEKLIVVSNFAETEYTFQLCLDKEAISAWRLADDSYPLEDQLGGNKVLDLLVKNGLGYVDMDLTGLESFILWVRNKALLNLSVQSLFTIADYNNPS